MVGFQGFASRDNVKWLIFRIHQIIMDTVSLLCSMIDIGKLRYGQLVREDDMDKKIENHNDIDLSFNWCLLLDAS
ncbi:unnamed protein product [Rhodiola kirilowii]